MAGTKSPIHATECASLRLTLSQILGYRAGRHIKPCHPSPFRWQCHRRGARSDSSTTGDQVKNLTRHVALAIATAALMSACTTTPAPEFGGKWRPVNRFADTTREIPLNPAYTYYALPMDGTLKGVLVRWAKDTHVGLSYQLSSDYTLPAAVGQ